MWFVRVPPGHGLCQPMSEFDSIMVRVEIGNSRKLRRLTPDQRWCVVAGVWCLAAKSPVRGYLLITDKESVTAQDVAEQAGVKLSVARSTLARMRDLDMLEVDDELHGEHVHDWHLHQKEPKSSETPEAWRERKRRQRERERHGDVTPDVTRDIRDIVTPESRVVSHPLREEKRRKEKRTTPPTPPAGGRARDKEKWEKEFAAWLQAHPVTPDLLKEWEPLAARLAESVPEGSPRIYMAGLHPHILGDEAVIGCERGIAQFVTQDRYSREIRRVLGMKTLTLIDCQCDLSSERAA